MNAAIRELEFLVNREEALLKLILKDEDRKRYDLELIQYRQAVRILKADPVERIKKMIKNSEAETRKHILAQNIMLYTANIHTQTVFRQFLAEIE